MATLLYTTTEAVRAAVGLDENDVPDSVLSDQSMDDQLLADLDEWLTTHATIKADGEAGSPTATEQKKWRWLQLYCMWYGAYLLANAPYAVPFLYDDGKSQIRRYDRIGYGEVAQHALEQARHYRSLLETELGLTTAGRVKLVGVVSPSYDTVTGDTT